MEWTRSVDESKRYTTTGPIFYDGDLIGVLDGVTVMGSMARKEITAVRLERRTSFKHPILGLILGGVLMAAGLYWFSLTSGDGFVLYGCLLGCGAYLLQGVVRRREIPWLVLVAGTTEREFPLRQDLPAAVITVIEEVTGRRVSFVSMRWPRT